MMRLHDAIGELDPPRALQRFDMVRSTTAGLADGLSDADATVQSMPDSSPAKWHLAHTTWFFETMVLRPYAPGYEAFDPAYDYLFNSYYESLGHRNPRALRSMITRPSLDEVHAYRAHVDAAMQALLGWPLTGEIAALVELGCQHEQQHQELILTDILHLFSLNPAHPAFRHPSPLAATTSDAPGLSFLAFEGGLIEVGHAGSGFAFDSERPRHRVYLNPFRMADTPVTNRDWTRFIADGGYEDPLLWLADGWASVERQRWSAPLYWEERENGFWSMTLRGFQPVDLDAPVTHVSFFEAAAFATWAGARLPTEAEWEFAAGTMPVNGNFADSGVLRPRASPTEQGGLRQMYGDVWEWTSSAFQPHPGFRPAAGAVGEYNGKFMSGQMVLKGGSCVTPAGHVRPSSRNFFPPETRWQFTGLRLAMDA